MKGATRSALKIDCFFHPMTICETFLVQRAFFKSRLLEIRNPEQPWKSLSTHLARRCYVKIESVMTKKPICCSPSDTVQRVAQMMRQQDVGAIPVVSDLVSKELIGIITDRDLCVTAM